MLGRQRGSLGRHCDWGLCVTFSQSHARGGKFWLASGGGGLSRSLRLGFSGAESGGSGSLGRRTGNWVGWTWTPPCCHWVSRSKSRCTESHIECFEQLNDLLCVASAWQKRSKPERHCHPLFSSLQRGLLVPVPLAGGQPILLLLADIFNLIGVDLDLFGCWRLGSSSAWCDRILASSLQYGVLSLINKLISPEQDKKRLSVEILSE